MGMHIETDGRFAINPLDTAVPGLTACKEMALVQMILANEEILARLSEADVPKFSKGQIAH